MVRIICTGFSNLLCCSFLLHVQDMNSLLFVFINNWDLWAVVWFLICKPTHPNEGKPCKYCLFILQLSSILLNIHPVHVYTKYIRSWYMALFFLLFCLKHIFKKTTELKVLLGRARLDLMLLNTFFDESICRYRSFFCPHTSS